MKSSSKTLSRTLVPALFAAALLSSSVQAATDPAIVALGVPASATTRTVEDVVIAYKTIGEQIGAKTIKLTRRNVKTAARQGADEILSKGGAPAISTPTDPNRAVNKADEIAELGAFLLAGIDNHPKFKRFDIQKEFIVIVAKGVLKSAKANGVMNTNTTIIRDVAGSLALTIANNPLYVKKLAKLQKFLNAKAGSIAGEAQTASYQQGNNDGFNKTVLPPDPANPSLVRGYEDGNIMTLATIKDPETDQRNA